MTFLSSESDLIFLFKHPRYLVFFKTFCFIPSSAKIFQHNLNPQANQVHKHIKLIQIYALKVAPKCVTILSPLDFKRLPVQVFSERPLHITLKYIYIYISYLYFCDLSYPIKAKTIFIYCYSY